MGIILFVILIFSVSFILALKDTKYNHTRHKADGTNESLENLHRMQNYEFWRDFEERGRQTEKK